MPISARILSRHMGRPRRSNPGGVSCPVHPGATMSGVHLFDRGFSELDAATLYALLRLRVDVFVVEQQCPYPELDGRDTEPTTRHLWLGPAATQPLSYLRILAEPDGVARI